MCYGRGASLAMRGIFAKQTLISVMQKPRFNSQLGSLRLIRDAVKREIGLAEQRAECR
jgi:hypothetical protein